MKSIIGVDMTVRGDLRCAGEIQVFGTVDGDVRGDLVAINQGGYVKGSVVADSVYIAGTVNGRVEANEVVVDSTAKITGDIFHNTLSMSGAAVHEGLRPWRPRRELGP